MKKGIFLFGIVLIFMSSCSLKELNGFYDGFDNLSIENQQRVKDFDSTASLNSKNIYKISTDELLTELSENDSSVVYLWNPKCDSEIYIEPSDFVRQSYERGLKPYVITRYLCNDIFQESIVRDVNIYALDIEEFNTNYCPKYLRRFLKKVSGSDESKMNLYLNTTFMRFEKDNYILSY